MGRFNSFNSQMSGFSEKTEDAGLDEDDNKEDEGLFSSPGDFIDIESESKVTCEVEMPASEEDRCDKNFTNAAFWKT